MNRNLTSDDDSQCHFLVQTCSVIHEAGAADDKTQA